MADTVMVADAPDSHATVLHEVTATPINAPSQWHVLAILSALMGFASISTDFYLPAMPTMARALNATTGSVEYTISGFLIGFSLGQLVWGAVSDRYGRRVPLAAGLILFVIGSAGCALSGSVETIIIWRIVQALGACAGVVLSRAMVRDLYQGPRAAQMLSTLIAIMAIAPLLGPILGGQIAELAGWRAIFWTLVGVGILTLAALFTLPETLPAARRQTAPLMGAFGEYGRLLLNRKILGYAGAGAFFYGGMYAYIAGTPFAFITYHHVAAEFYGFLFGAGILGIIATNILNTRLVLHYGIDRMLVSGTAAAALAGIIVAATSFTDWGGLWGLFVPLLLFVSVTGFIVANSIAGAMADFPEQAGAVSALVGALQYGAGIASSGLVGGFADGTPWPMGWVIAVTGIGSLLCAFLVVHKNVPAINEVTT
ncbi:drug resistance transporter, Bcr/CflA subfamily [Rhodomicrobium vannielii ATCC 17100]|uniref:Bcr/CflA family efflux transporter n=1 Tax=Rhodomicrobium vannielii (strain ATCC 17100 / DSM 162 / LMG 4299 / NCIMB 10020 / ATH 3.1.1) TaxID=648757 RepID=E3I341_RHOVT|nr:multidrug effflux MFS transporter [Rhodomicrobium vannielii]ADP70335.1 drug resistance transporter, Bcr/CflA subfamily [Rhodomicrobium vannielii ATCC 17100]